MTIIRKEVIGGRTALPDRRPHQTTTVHWNGQSFPVSIGKRWIDDGSEVTPEQLTAAMQPADVFADVAKGGDLQWVIADACVLISIALQHGISPDDLAKSLGVVPGKAWDKETEEMVDVLLPASPLGAVVNAIREEVGQ